MYTYDCIMYHLSHEQSPQGAIYNAHQLSYLIGYPVPDCCLYNVCVICHTISPLREPHPMPINAAADVGA
jgi:hypothetical protein